MHLLRITGPLRTLVIALLAWAASIGYSVAETTLAPPDLHLQAAIEKTLRNQQEKAIPAARAAREAEPQSRLAHWLEAQAILVQSGQFKGLSKNDQDLLKESEARLHRVPPGHLPRNILSFGRQLDIGRYLLLADLSVSRIYVFDISGPQPQMVREMYSSIGLAGAVKLREGDRRTPIGVYRLLKEIKNPRADGFLGDLAITLDYPNAEDRRAKRTGSGIWIHGVPHEVHVRPPRSSDGCLAVSNADMLALREYVDFAKTHIVIVPQVQWLSQEKWAEESRRMLSAMDFPKGFGGNSGQAVFYISKDRPIVSIARQENRITRAYWAHGQRRSPLLIEEL
nr:hypothetical protein NCPCFENI_00542 [Cupriavidus sp.]